MGRHVARDPVGRDFDSPGHTVGTHFPECVRDAPRFTVVNLADRDLRNPAGRCPAPVSSSHGVSVSKFRRRALPCPGPRPGVPVSKVRRPLPCSGLVVPEVPVCSRPSGSGPFKRGAPRSPPGAPQEIPWRAAKSHARTCDFEPPPPPRCCLDALESRPKSQLDRNETKDTLGQYSNLTVSANSTDHVESAKKSP